MSVLVGLIGYSLCLTGSRRRGQASVTGTHDDTRVFHLRRLAIENSLLFQDLGLTANMFQLKAPRDATWYFWIETYKHGELVRDLSYGCYIRPNPNGDLVQTKTLRWTEYHRPDPQPTNNGKIAWTLADDDFCDRRWIDDPFGKFFLFSGGGEPAVLRGDLGTTYVIRSKIASHGTFSEDRKKNDVTVFLKCRIEAAKPGRLAGCGVMEMEFPPFQDQ